MPASTGVVQEAGVPLRPSISTRQSRQEPNASSISVAHRRGICVPRLAAAAITEVPAGTLTLCPSMVSVTIAPPGRIGVPELNSWMRPIRASYSAATRTASAEKSSLKLSIALITGSGVRPPSAQSDPSVSTVQRSRISSRFSARFLPAMTLSTVSTPRVEPIRHGGAMVTLTIDGQSVSVPAGTSVMAAAASLGTQIPRLCATDMLEAFGSCRLCLVEIEGRKGTPASCTTPVEAGMKVKTETPRLAKLRRGVMELYISDHPLDCLTCSANGDCELQAQAGAVGLREVRYGDGKIT